MKINDILWEKILYMSLSNYENCIYNEGSHSIGTDISSEKYGNISCKSGVYSKNGDKIRFSGSRTTSLKTLSEKRKFISEGEVDFYFNLATSSTVNDNNYYLMKFPSSLIRDNIPDNWDFDGKKWRAMNDVMQVDIVRSMSDQIWYIVSCETIDIIKIVPRLLSKEEYIEACELIYNFFN